jgi:hypothetical protein
MDHMSKGQKYWDKKNKGVCVPKPNMDTGEF